MLISVSPLGLRQPLRSKGGPLPAHCICSQRLHCVPPPPGPYVRRLVRVRALGGANDSTGAPQKHELPDQQQPTSVSMAARHLLSVTALAFFTLVATVVRDRATSPIIPPLIPRIDTLTSSPGADSVVQYASASVETGIETISADTKAPVKPSRSLLRALWGTATLPVKLVDTLLFPEESLVRPSTTSSATSSSSKQTVPSIRSPAADASPATRVHPATLAPAPASQAASPAPSFTDAPAAAGNVLDKSSTGLDASTALQSAEQHSSMPGMMHVLQEAFARMARQEQADSTAAPAPAADHAAALAAVRFLMGNEGMGLLPVILVTSATAAAGLMLAATMAGLAGLVDKRRASSPAQRAAEVALLDSPLRPISCPTMPGFLPMLPPSIEPIFYRWRDNDTSNSTSSDSSDSTSSSAAAVSKAPAAAEDHKAAAADVAGPAEPQQEQDWWSFSQIAALRLMPLLPTSAGNNKQAAGSISAITPDITPAAPASTAAAAVTAGAAAAGGSSIAASPDASSTAAETSAGSFDEVAAALARAAASTTVDPDDLAMWGSDAEVLFGPAWCYAVQLVTVDALEDRPGTAWEICRAFGAAAPAKLLAEVCCFLPAAVANCHTAVGLWELDGPPGTAAGWIWDYASRMTAQLLGGDPGRVEAVAEAMGIVATAERPDVMHGVLQERSQLLLAEYDELHLLGDLTFGDVPDIDDWLTDAKAHRVDFAQAAYRSSILATYTVLELWPEVIEAAAAQSDAGGMDSSAESQWQQPRLMMRHTQLLEQCLLDVLQGQQPPKLAVAKVLSISSSPVATGQRTSQLTVMQAGPPRVQRLVSARHAALAAQLPRYSKEQLLEKHSVDDILQLPDVNGAYWDWEDVCEQVVLALRHGLLLAKPPQAAMLYQLRPGWPAAQFLALAHSLLCPSQLDVLLNSIKLDADDQGLLASVLMLLPAAVLHVRHHWETELAEGLSSSTETATAVCLRIYAGLLGGTGAPGHTALSALGAFGLNPDAVIAAATAESGMAAAPAGASTSQQLYWGPSDSLLGQLADFQGNAAGVLGIMVEHPARLSFVVSLTLLLHLASSEGWERGSTPCSPPDEPVQLLPAWYWDILIGEFSGSNLYTLPGASMAAAVLRAGFTEAKAAAVPNGRMSVEAIALEAAQLLAQASSSSSSSRPPADWEHDLTKAVVATGDLTDICDTAEGALEIVDDEAAWRLGLAPWLEEDSSDADEEEACEAEEGEGADSDAEADSSSSSDRLQADQEAVNSGSDSPQAAASYAEEQEDHTASQEEASSDEDEACMEDSSCGNALDSQELEEAVAANKAEAAAETAAAAKAAAEAAVATAAASKSAYHSLMAQLEAATAEAPDALLQQLEQLSEAQDRLGRAWQLALHLVLADDMLDATASAELLQQCAATATAPLLADVCALLPAAVVNYQGAATAATGGRQGSRAESSWDAAARLLTQLLSPAGTGSEGISRLREVCGELGLYAQARFKGDSRQFRGKLQHLAESYQDTVDTLESFKDLSWEPAGQFVREWLLTQYEQPCQLRELALRSCVMASYLSMELWYEQDCPVVAYDPDNTRELFGAYDSTRAALLSHYELLKQLQGSKQDSSWLLPELIAGTAESAEDSRFVEAFMAFLRGHPPPLSIFDASPMQDTWFSTLLLETARPYRFTGKLPDLASYQDFLLVLQQVQQGMNTQLQLPQAGAAAGASGASAAVDSEASQVIEKIMNTCVMGQRVMPTRNGTHKVLRWLQAELPEWQTASQLALLWSWFPFGRDTALLQHFAASAAESSLARVCALLPAAAANVGLTSDEVADMLFALTAAQEGPATVTAVLKELGFHGEVVAAATAAAAAATAPGERVEAAAAAIRETGLQLELAGGFLSQLAKRNRIQAGTVPGMLVYGSIAAALPMLLDLLVDNSDDFDDEASTDNHPTGPDAAAARASSPTRSNDAPLLPLKEWVWLAAQFAAIEVDGDAAGMRAAAAAAALMQQGVLAAQAREQGVLPAGFRISLSEGHKASEGRVAWQDCLDVADRAFQQRAEGYGPVVLDFKGQKRGVGILRRSRASPQIAGSQAAATASSPEPLGEPSAGAEASSAGQNPGKVIATTDQPAAAAEAAAAVDDTGIDSNQASRDDKRQPKEQKSKARRQQEDAEPRLQGAKGSSSKAAEQSTAAASSRTECGHDDSADEKATTQATAAIGEDMVPTVKKLLGLPVDPTDASSSSSDLVPNRLALLVCQAMLMRGDDAQQKLQAAVGYLATCSMRDTLPAMLAGCMEALFTTDDWDSLSGSARQVLSSLSVVLPASGYLALQKHLMAKGLVKELEVPAEFD